jgi:hypothetical protein
VYSIQVPRFYPNKPPIVHMENHHKVSLAPPHTCIPRRSSSCVLPAAHAATWPQMHSRHPCVDRDGRLHLSILSDEWMCVYSIQTVFRALETFHAEVPKVPNAPHPPPVEDSSAGGGPVLAHPVGQGALPVGPLGAPSFIPFADPVGIHLLSQLGPELPFSGGGAHRQQSQVPWFANRSRLARGVVAHCAVLRALLVTYSLPDCWLPALAFVGDSQRILFVAG